MDLNQALGAKIRKDSMGKKDRAGFSLLDLMCGLFLIGMSALLLYSTFRGMGAEARKARVLSLASELDSEISQYLAQTQAWTTESESLVTGTVPSVMTLNLPSAIPLQHPQARKVYLDREGNLCADENSCDLVLEFEVRRVAVGSTFEVAYAYRVRPTQKVRAITGAFQGYGVGGDGLFNDEDFSHVVPQSILMSSSACTSANSSGIRGLDATGNPICLALPSLACPSNQIPFAFHFDGTQLKLDCRPLKKVGCASPGYVLQSINPAQFLKGTNGLPNFGLLNPASTCVWSGPDNANLQADGTCPAGYIPFGGACAAPPPMGATLDEA